MCACAQACLSGCVVSVHTRVPVSLKNTLDEAAYVVTIIRFQLSGRISLLFWAVRVKHAESPLLPPVRDSCHTHVKERTCQASELVKAELSQLSSSRDTFSHRGKTERQPAPSGLVPGRPLLENGQSKPVTARKTTGCICRQ